MSYYKHIILTLNNKLTRSQRIGEFLSKFKNGNCIEIGAGNGDTTIEIAKHAKQVLVIDPFKYQEGADKSFFTPYPLHVFLKKTSEFNNITLHQEMSLHESTKEVISNLKPVFFAFVDGLQFKEIVLKELNIMSNADVEIICVDDVNRLTGISEVPLAIEEFLKTNNKYEFIDIGVQEGYLIKL